MCGSAIPTGNSPSEPRRFCQAAAVTVFENNGHAIRAAACPLNQNRRAAGRRAGRKTCRLNDPRRRQIQSHEDKRTRGQRAGFRRRGHRRVAQVRTKWTDVLMRRLLIVVLRRAAIGRFAGRMTDRKSARRIRRCSHKASGAEPGSRELQIKREDRETGSNSAAKRHVCRHRFCAPRFLETIQNAIPRSRDHSSLSRSEKRLRYPQLSQGSGMQRGRQTRAVWPNRTFLAASVMGTLTEGLISFAFS